MGNVFSSRKRDELRESLLLPDQDYVYLTPSGNEIRPAVDGMEAFDGWHLLEGITSPAAVQPGLMLTAGSRARRLPRDAFPAVAQQLAVACGCLRAPPPSPSLTPPPTPANTPRSTCCAQPGELISLAPPSVPSSALQCVKMLGGSMGVSSSCGGSAPELPSVPLLSVPF